MKLFSVGGGGGHFCLHFFSLALLLGLCSCSCTFVWTLCSLLHFCLDFLWALPLLLGLWFCPYTFAWTLFLLGHFCLDCLCLDYVFVFPYVWTLFLLFHFCLDFVFAFALLLGPFFGSCTFAWTFFQACTFVRTFQSMLDSTLRVFRILTCDLS